MTTEKQHRLIGYCADCRFSRSLREDEMPPELREQFPYCCEALPPPWQIIPVESKLSLAGRSGHQEIRVVRPPNVKRPDDGCVFFTPEGPVEV